MTILLKSLDQGTRPAFKYSLPLKFCWAVSQCFDFGLKVSLLQSNAERQEGKLLCVSAAANTYYYEVVIICKQTFVRSFVRSFVGSDRQDWVGLQFWQRKGGELKNNISQSEVKNLKYFVNQLCDFLIESFKPSNLWKNHPFSFTSTNCIRIKDAILHGSCSLECSWLRMTGKHSGKFFICRLQWFIVIKWLWFVNDLYLNLWYHLVIPVWYFRWYNNHDSLGGTE